MTICESLPGGFRTITVFERELHEYRNRVVAMAACVTLTPTATKERVDAQARVPQPAAQGVGGPGAAATVVPLDTAAVVPATATPVPEAATPVPSPDAMDSVPTGVPTPEETPTPTPAVSARPTLPVTAAPVTGGPPARFGSLSIGQFIQVLGVGIILLVVVGVMLNRSRK